MLLSNLWPSAVFTILQKKLGLRDSARLTVCKRTELAWEPRRATVCSTLHAAQLAAEFLAGRPLWQLGWGWGIRKQQGRGLSSWQIGRSCKGTQDRTLGPKCSPREE